MAKHEPVKLVIPIIAIHFDLLSYRCNCLNVIYNIILKKCIVEIVNFKLDNYAIFLLLVKPISEFLRD